jgi:hypothetical protein
MGGAKLLLIVTLLLLWFPVYQNTFHKAQQSSAVLIHVPKPQHRSIERDLPLRQSPECGAFHITGRSSLKEAKFFTSWRLEIKPRTTDYRFG